MGHHHITLWVKVSYSNPYFIFRNILQLEKDEINFNTHIFPFFHAHTSLSFQKLANTYYQNKSLGIVGHLFIGSPVNHQTMRTRSLSQRNKIQNRTWEQVEIPNGRAGKYV